MAGWFILLSGWPRLGIAFLAGVVSAFSMPPFDLIPLLFLTFPVLVWLLDSAASEPSSGIIRKFSHGFKPGFAFGFGYFLAGIWWIGVAFLVDTTEFLWALPVAVICIPALLALFWGVATGIAGLFWSGSIRRIFLLAALLGIAEYLRGFIATGFPWNTLGYAAFPTPLLMQTASVIGIYGATPFVVLAASVLGTIVPGMNEQHVARRRVIKFVVLLIACHALFGFWRLNPNTEGKTVEGVSLRLVQPAIPQHEKFDPAKHTEHLKRYMDLSSGPGKNEKTGLSGTTYLFWPESVFPYLLTERRDTLSAIAAMLPEGTSLITGAVRAEAGTTGRPDFIFNSVYVINDKGLIVSAADKVHLVPFGEYLPFQSFLESMGLQQLTKVQGGFEPGSSRKILSTANGPDFLPLICYEIIFSGDILPQNQSRPAFMVNLTNDAWFGNTPGPYQHERQAIIRGVEEGLPLVRVSNSGISGVYDAYGRTLYRLELGEVGVIDSALPIMAERTVYSHFNKWVIWCIILLFLIAGVAPTRKRKY